MYVFNNQKKLILQIQHQKYLQSYCSFKIKVFVLKTGECPQLFNFTWNDLKSGLQSSITLKKYICFYMLANICRFSLSGLFALHLICILILLKRMINQKWHLKTILRHPIHFANQNSENIYDANYGRSQKSFLKLFLNNCISNSLSIS